MSDTATVLTHDSARTASSTGAEKSKRDDLITAIAGHKLMLTTPPHVFATRSYGPSTPAPRNVPHLPTCETHRPLRPDAPVFNPAAAAPVLHNGRLALRTTLNPPASPPRARVIRHVEF